MAKGPAPKPVPADLAETFPCTPNDVLAARHGVGVGTVIRWARAAGLSKAPSYISTIRAAQRLKVVEQDGMKRCIGCGILKPLDEFYDSSSKRRKMPRCKPCHKKKAETWRRDNPAATKRLTRRSQLKQAYGISDVQWDAIHAAQGGSCAICGRIDDGSLAARRLHTDHCHDSGAVRGLLCGSCNSGIGRFQHDIELLRSAIRYLENPPAAAVL
jgi:hypothetical protein